MNKEHLAYCSSAEWAEVVGTRIIPWVLDGVDLGDDVVEVGPGPGVTTDILRTIVPHITAVELDDDLAASLAQRMKGTNVEVVHADASDTQLPGDRFSGAVCLTMLHHVPSKERQDALLGEVFRILKTGGVLVGEDSVESPEARAVHTDDTYVPVDPAGFEDRLRTAGFASIDISSNEAAFRFRATKA